MKSTEQIEFKLAAITVLETHAVRVAGISAESVIIAVDYELDAKNYRSGTPEVTIETQYTIRLLSADSADGAEGEELGSLRTRIAVAVEADRVVTAEDAKLGRFDVAEHLVNVSSLPYHRQLIMTMSSTLGFPPVELPVDFEEVADGFAASALVLEGQS